MKYIKEEGEPTNSISGGSMDSHEPTDGGNDSEVLTRKGCKKKKRKKSKYQEYKESMEVDCNSMGWFEMDFTDFQELHENLIDLNISKNDYKLENRVVSFKHEEDMYNVQELMDNSIE